MAEYGERGVFVSRCFRARRHFLLDFQLEEFGSRLEFGLAGRGAPRLWCLRLQGAIFQVRFLGF